MIASLAKFLVKIFSLLFKSSKHTFLYLLNKVMLAETDFYVDYEYSKTYPHIRKAINFIKKYKNFDGLILDIGAANATTPKKFASSLPNELWAFEPLEQNKKYFEEINIKYPSIKFFPFALGSDESMQKINITENITSSSLKQVNKDDISNDIFKTALRVNDEIEIEVKRMDDIVPSSKKVSLIKIDVQGFELEVLKGGINTLKNTDLVIIEVSNHSSYKDSPRYFDIDKFMLEHNFTLFDMSLNVRENGHLLEWDAFYINKSFRL